MAQVRWTLQALDDLEAICMFIARDAPGVAAVFAQKAFDTAERLANFPRSGRTVSELANLDFPSGLREIILGNYRLIYRIRSGDVQILTVHHAARLLDTAQFHNTG